MPSAESAARPPPLPAPAMGSPKAGYGGGCAPNRLNPSLRPIPGRGGIWGIIPPLLALLDASALKENRERQLGKVGRGARTGSAIERTPASAFCSSRAITSRSPGSREAIDCADNHDVAATHSCQELLELGTVGRRSADLLPKHGLACCGVGELAGEVLGVGRDAGVTEDHLCNSASTTARSGGRAWWIVFQIRRS